MHVPEESGKKPELQVQSASEESHDEFASVHVIFSHGSVKMVNFFGSGIEIIKDNMRYEIKKVNCET